MGLTDYLTKTADGIKTNASFTKQNITDYLMGHDRKLKKYFSGDIPDEEKEKLRGNLEKRVDNLLDKYIDELRGFARKATTRGAMGLAIVNDLSGYISNVPFANVSGFAYTLFAIKTAAEIPAMYRYFKKSHDWYGALAHYIMKPIKYLIPVIGPAWEAGSFEKMVRKRVLKEAKYGFIKENGDYQTFEDKIKEKLKTPIKEVSERPVKRLRERKEPEPQPAIAA